MKTLLALLLFFQLSALPWSEERHMQLVNETKKINLSCCPSYEYPVNIKPCHFTAGKIYIFAYGSLLDRDSAERHLSSETFSTYKPAIAFGLMRIFDRHVPYSVQMGKLPEDQTAMLNARKVKDLSQIVNGILIEVNQKDFEELAKREIGYDLVPIPVTYWDEAFGKAKPHIFIAYAFSSPRALRKGCLYSKPGINPYPPYVEMCQKAAATHGPEFLKLWIETTYLSDEVTPFSEWKNPNFKTL